jgi:hypothetical protein
MASALSRHAESEAKRFPRDPWNLTAGEHDAQ